MRLYQPFFDEKTIILDERNKHHAINVMRLREGEVCYIFDGQGHEVKTQITRITKKEVALDILEKIENHTESSLNIHLFQALCKGDKMDVIIQKSVELGVTEITPLITERCDVKLSGERLEKKMTHWQNIIIHATEQSGRAVLAKLNEPLSFQHAMQSNSESLQLLLTPNARSSLRAQRSNPEKINIFIGPEGGFSAAEIDFAIEHDVDAISFGRRILRTETAPLAVIASLQVLWGDFR